MDIRNAQPLRLNVAICHRHLLYDAACVRAGLPAPRGGGGWQHLSHVLSVPERMVGSGPAAGFGFLASFLSRFSGQLIFYIPDRYSEGDGISFQGIDHAKQEGVTLIIALDCGIKSHDKVTYASEKGIDFIICDHHRPDDTLLAAVAVLDPKRDDCPYPFKELSGCGIGFKLMQGLAQRNNSPSPNWNHCSIWWP